MSDHPEQDITTQIIVQIRDEMRSMRLHFEGALKGIEAHLEHFKKRLDSVEAHMASAESHRASITNDLASIESKNEVRHQKLLRRLDRIETDLKKFVGLANDTILHYADEMDSVRERVDILEKSVGILPPPE